VTLVPDLPLIREVAIWANHALKKSQRRLPFKIACDHHARRIIEQHRHPYRRFGPRKLADLDYFAVYSQFEIREFEICQRPSAHIEYGNRDRHQVRIDFDHAFFVGVCGGRNRRRQWQNIFITGRGVNDR